MTLPSDIARCPGRITHRPLRSRHQRNLPALARLCRARVQHHIIAAHIIPAQAAQLPRPHPSL
jgi:hypothetical protein